MLEGTSFRQLMIGVHIRADAPLGLRAWLEGACLVLPTDAIVTSLTGLHVRGVLVGPAWPLRLVTRSPRQVRRPRLLVSRASQLPAHSGRLAVSEHCFAAACGELDLVDAVAAGDWLVHRRHTTVEALAAYANGYRGKGASMARTAVRFVRERVESPRETLLRMLLVLAGLPEPRCNVDLGDVAGFIGRGDLVYDAHALVVEYDGRQHAEDAGQWEWDLDRLDDLETARWGHVRVTARRLRQPRSVVRRVHAKLVTRGYTGPAPTFDATWVALFETRTAAERARDAPDPESWGPRGGTRPR